LKKTLTRLKDSKRLSGYDKIFRKRITEIFQKEFIKRVVRASQLRRFETTNNQIKQTRYYLLFFSKICKIMKLKQNLDIIYNNARSKYQEKMKRKALVSLNRYTEFSVSNRSNEIRRKFVQKMFYKNLKENLVKFKLIRSFPFKIFCFTGNFT